MGRMQKVFKQAELQGFSHIHSWRDLGHLLGVRTYIMSNSLRNKDNLQKRITLKGRTVYKSLRGLKFVQERIQLLMESLMSSVPTDHLLAYISGRDARAIIADKCTSCKYLVHFDIKKYYDNITTSHIENALVRHDFTPNGARLVARYCTVKRTTKRKDGKIRTISSLQQGSPASPVISNLVGHYEIDMPVMSWLRENAARYPKLEYSYYRYSDNVFLFLNGDIPVEFLREYKAYIWDSLPKRGFLTHKWHMIPHNHPKRNMKILGIVVNKQARLEHTVYDRMRAMLLNVVRFGLSAEAKLYYEEAPRPDVPLVETLGVRSTLDANRYWQVLAGKVAYLKSINPRHYLECQKLLKAARITEELRVADLQAVGLAGSTTSQQTRHFRNYIGLIGPRRLGGYSVSTERNTYIQLHPLLFAAIKMYRDQEELVEAYEARITSLITAMRSQFVAHYDTLKENYWADMSKDLLVPGDEGATPDVAANGIYAA